MPIEGWADRLLAWPFGMILFYCLMGLLFAVLVRWKGR